MNGKSASTIAVQFKEEDSLTSKELVTTPMKTKSTSSPESTVRSPSVNQKSSSPSLTAKPSSPKPIVPHSSEPISMNISNLLSEATDRAFRNDSKGSKVIGVVKVANKAVKHVQPIKPQVTVAGKSSLVIEIWF